MKAYAHATLPGNWLIKKDELVYLVPAIPKGWNRRRLLANVTLLNTAVHVDVSQLSILELPESVSGGTRGSA